MSMKGTLVASLNRVNQLINFQSFRAAVAFAAQFLSKNMLFAVGHGLMAAATHSVIVLVLCKLAEFVAKSAFGATLIPRLFSHLGAAVVSYLPAMLVPFAPYLILTIPLSIFTLALLRGDVSFPAIRGFAEADKSFLFLMVTILAPVAAYLYGFSLGAALIGSAVVASPWNIFMPIFQEAMFTYQENLLYKNSRTPILDPNDNDHKFDDFPDQSNSITEDYEMDEEQDELFNEETMPPLVPNFERQEPDIYRFGKPIPPPSEETSPTPRYR